MITLRLYKNFNKKDNSTKRPGDSIAYDDKLCTLKDSSTITNPVISLALLSDPATLGYNYAYIEAFNRYYFITEWTYSLGLWTCNLSVDVLASYKTQIGAETHYVLRAKDAYTIDPTAVNIPDTLYPATNSKRVYTQRLAPADSPFSYTSGTYVIGIINGGASTSGNNVGQYGITKYYVISAAQVKSLVSYLMSNNFADNYLVDAAAGASRNVVKDFVDPLQYISSLRWYPFTVTPFSVTEKPYIGFWDTTSDNNIPSLAPVNQLTQVITNNKLVVYENPIASLPGKEFTKYAPYVSHRIKFDPWGIFELDSQLISEMTAGNAIYMGITVDLITGMGRLDLSTNVNYTCELGSHVAMVGVNMELAQITQDIVSSGAGIAKTALEKAASWIEDKTGWSGFKKKADGAADVATGVMSALGLGRVSMTRAGSQDSMLSYLGLNSTPELITEYYDCVGVDVEEAGQPLCKKVRLDTLSGFILCGGIETEIAALEPERAAVDSYLNGGFYYE